MTEGDVHAQKRREEIIKDLLLILEDMSSGWESQFGKALGPETMMRSDLEFRSIDVARFIAGIQKKYGPRELPFQDLLMPDDRDVEDLSLADVADFLRIHLEGA